MGEMYGLNFLQRERKRKRASLIPYLSFGQTEKREKEPSSAFIHCHTRALPAQLKREKRIRASFVHAKKGKEENHTTL